MICLKGDHRPLSVLLTAEILRINIQIEYIDIENQNFDPISAECFLLDENSEVIKGSYAIMLYLAQKSKNSLNLIGKNNTELFKVKDWINYCQRKLDDKIVTISFKKILNENKTISKEIFELYREFNILNTNFEDSTTYLTLDRLTLADIALVGSLYGPFKNVYNFNAGLRISYNKITGYLRNSELLSIINNMKGEFKQIASYYYRNFKILNFNEISFEIAEADNDSKSGDGTKNREKKNKSEIVKITQKDEIKIVDLEKPNQSKFNNNKPSEITFNKEKVVNAKIEKDLTKKVAKNHNKNKKFAYVEENNSLKKENLERLKKSDNANKSQKDKSKIRDSIKQEEIKVKKLKSKTQKKELIINTTDTQQRDKINSDVKEINSKNDQTSKINFSALETESYFYKKENTDSESDNLEKETINIIIKPAWELKSCFDYEPKKEKKRIQKSTETLKINNSISLISFTNSPVRKNIIRNEQIFVHKKINSHIERISSRSNRVDFNSIENSFTEMKSTSEKAKAYSGSPYKDSPIKCSIPIDISNNLSMVTNSTNFQLQATKNKDNKVHESSKITKDEQNYKDVLQKNLFVTNKVETKFVTTDHSRDISFQIEKDHVSKNSKIVYDKTNKKDKLNKISLTQNQFTIYENDRDSSKMQKLNIEAKSVNEIRNKNYKTEKGQKVDCITQNYFRIFDREPIRKCKNNEKMSIDPLAKTLEQKSSKVKLDELEIPKNTFEKTFINKSQASKKNNTIKKEDKLNDEIMNLKVLNNGKKPLQKIGEDIYLWDASNSVKIPQNTSEPIIKHKHHSQKIKIISTKEQNQKSNYIKEKNKNKILEYYRKDFNKNLKHPVVENIIKNQEIEQVTHNQKKIAVNESKTININSSLGFNHNSYQSTTDFENGSNLYKIIEINGETPIEEVISLKPGEVIIELEDDKICSDNNKMRTIKSHKRTYNRMPYSIPVQKPLHPVISLDSGSAYNRVPSFGLVTSQRIIRSYPFEVSNNAPVLNYITPYQMVPIESGTFNNICYIRNDGLNPQVNTFKKVGTSTFLKSSNYNKNPVFQQNKSKRRQQLINGSLRSIKRRYV